MLGLCDSSPNLGLPFTGSSESRVGESELIDVKLRAQASHVGRLEKYYSLPVLFAIVAMKQSP